MAIRVLHTGDWHIGNFPGPDMNGENARFLDICKCLESILETAKTQCPDIIIVSGDIYHQARVWSDRGLRESQTAISIIRRLSVQAPVVIVRGTPNHDSAEQFEMLKTAFQGDESVHILTEPQVVKICTRGERWVQVAALPGFDRGYYRAKHPGLSREEENEVFTSELEKIIMGLRAQCDNTAPTILSAHYTVPGCNMESGQTALFSQFEPVIYPATLTAAGFDLVALGHIHRPQELPESGNAYYCGSICGLNFNDEGQERGCWIHDIECGERPHSQFFKTPYREFLTIRLGNEEVGSINTEGFDEFSKQFSDVEVGGKIVRVLYTCTDENNKALNKALMEKALYDNGAFWVQEITPEEITVSVNREVMGGDNTPEDNLKSYLVEKEFEPEQVEHYTELARPIISEALEKTRVESASGIFMPVEIEVHNYRNYRDETFNYEQVKFATVNGENGAGKSSLFMDAMLDALYEEPREGDLTGWICNAEDARSGSIKFTFRLGKRTYRVTRTRQKSGKATLNLSELVDGEWEDRSAERFKDTQAAIEHTIGMDSLTLKACALIMQDQYGLFLTADKENRMSILGNILGLGIYGDMENAASDQATETNREVRRLNDAADEIARSLPDEKSITDELEQNGVSAKGTQESIEAHKQEAENIRFKLRVANEAADRAAKIRAEIHSIESKKAAASTSQRLQKIAVDDADAILSKELEISAGVQRYETLAEQEKSMLGQMALYDTKKTESSRIEKELADARRKKATITAERNALGETRWSYEQAIADEPRLKVKADRYPTEKAALASLQQKADDYMRLTQEAADAQRTVDKARAALSSGKSLRMAEIKTLKEKSAMLENSGCIDPQNASCKFLRAAKEAKEAIPSTEEALESFTTEQEQTVSELEKKHQDILNRIASLHYSQEELTQQRAAVDEAERNSRKYNGLAVFHQKLTALDERVEAIGKETEELDGKIDGLQEEADRVSKELTGMEDIAEKYKEISSNLAAEKLWLEKDKLLPAAREKKASAEARLTELSGEIEELNSNSLLKSAELEKEEADATESENYRRSLTTFEDAIASEEQKLQKLNMVAGALHRQLDELKTGRTRMEELRSQAKTQGELATGYEILKTAFSQDGIPHNIVRSIIPAFEATATNILGQMSGGHMNVEFRTEKTLKSNSKKEVTALDIIINDTVTGELPYMSRSGGERVKAALSIILALSEIKSHEAGIQMGFLFIDEPPFLDAQGVQAYCDALEAIQRRYSSLKVLAITHDPAMKARFPQSIDVVKTDEGSKVIYS